MKRSNVIFWLVLGIALIAVALAAGAPPDDGTPLDPRATGPLGAKALVLTLEELGGRVDITPRVNDQFDTAVLLRDDLTDDQRSNLEAWVSAGGTLLVADPSSPLQPIAVSGRTQTIFGEATVARGSCTIPPLEHLDRVDPTGGVLFDADVAHEACFTRPDGAFVVAQPRDAGWVVATGGAGPFVNDRLDSEDNAALAANILVPHEGARVAFLERANPGTGEGDKSLADLVPTRVRMALAQLLIAFVVFALWKGRRLGRPVAEIQPVEIAGSELVVAVGNLLQKAGRPQAAAERLREDLHRDLTNRLGIAPTASADVIADLAAQRTGCDRATVASALAGPLPTSAESLVAAAREMEEVRTAVLGSRA
ncbi:MAG TPA: DUF4350 domain-containing protein [Acidimicrobiales bacterium]|nr:DUF4350 domain-containing protein [Acidimicrobiales bacterium]